MNRPMRSWRNRRTARRGQHGLTLVEAVLVIAIGGIVLASIAGAIAWAAARSASTWPTRQALFVGEALLSEIALQPFTRCDADGPAASRGATCALANKLARICYATLRDHKPFDEAAQLIRKENRQSFAMPN